MIVRFWGKKEGFLFAFANVNSIQYERGYLWLYNIDHDWFSINRLNYDYYTIEREDVFYGKD